MSSADRVGSPSRNASDPATLLSRLQAFGAPFREVILTRNRRVMASVDASRTRLRLHHAFVDAPPAVLRALARLWTGGSRERAPARRVVAEYVRAAIPPASAAPVRRVRRPQQSDHPHLERLRTEFDRVNAEAFGGRLPSVPLALSGRMRRRNGHFTAEPLEIVLSRRLCTHGAVGEAEQTLRHEMIHLWQHVAGHRPGHGADFRAWAERLGVHPRACRAVTWRDGSGE